MTRTQVGIVAKASTSRSGDPLLFDVEDAAFETSTELATSRGPLHQPLFRDPLTAHDAEVGVPATPAPRSHQRHRHSCDTQANHNPDSSHLIPFRPMPV